MSQGDLFPRPGPPRPSEIPDPFAGIKPKAAAKPVTPKPRYVPGMGNRWQANPAHTSGIRVADYLCPKCGMTYERFAPGGHRHPQERYGLLCFACAGTDDAMT